MLIFVLGAHILATLDSHKKTCTITHYLLTLVVSSQANLTYVLKIEPIQTLIPHHKLPEVLIFLSAIM